VTRSAPAAVWRTSTSGELTTVRTMARRGVEGDQYGRRRRDRQSEVQR